MNKNVMLKKLIVSLRIQKAYLQKNLQKLKFTTIYILTKCTLFFSDQAVQC